MSSERTLASTFFAAFRLSSAEFAGEMQVLLLEATACKSSEGWHRPLTGLDEITMFYAYRDF